eukprot:3612671-Alexandrium_andersonii.AAC.1
MLSRRALFGHRARCADHPKHQHGVNSMCMLAYAVLQCITRRLPLQLSRPAPPALRGKGCFGFLLAPAEHSSAIEPGVPTTPSTGVA